MAEAEAMTEKEYDKNHQEVVLFQSKEFISTTLQKGHALLSGRRYFHLNSLTNPKGVLLSTTMSSLFS
jgi:hypothetical protein